MREEDTPASGNFNGLVICFQKFILGSKDYPVDVAFQRSPVCCGYFGSVDVHHVEGFKQYIKLASVEDACYPCTRKQLLCYTLDPKFSAGMTVDCRSSKERRNDPSPHIPFHFGTKEHDMACCTIINLNRSSKQSEKICIKDAAEQLYTLLENYQKAQNDDKAFSFAILGLLGSEDLCVITAANQYKTVHNGILQIQQLKLPESQKYLVDNSHSVFMLDGGTEEPTEWDENTEKPAVQDENTVDPAVLEGWAGIYADIHFSVRSLDGSAIICKIAEELKKSVGKTENVEMICHFGEYDFTIRCPGYMLQSYLFGGKKLFKKYLPQNSEFLYQSETIIYSKDSDIQKAESFCDADSEAPDNACKTDETNNMEDFVKAAIASIKNNLAPKTDQKDSVSDSVSDLAFDSDFSFIGYTIYRLLKDYQSIATYPYCTEMLKDFEFQFKTTINAIIQASMDKHSKIRDFIVDFDSIVTSFSGALQAASQLDRLNFAEQFSHLQNIGSYFKILNCYYGVIKKILAFLYHIPRKGVQSTLVPILSFGLTPIIVSKKYKSFIGEESQQPAVLLTVQLPYQALANPPKYIGILIHEIFHYAAPVDREFRNRTLLTCAARAALQEFISLLERQADTGFKREFGLTFAQNYPDLFNNLCDDWVNNILMHAQQAELFHIETVELDMLDFWLDKMFKIAIAPMKGDYDTYSFYIDHWRNIRKYLLDRKSSDPVLVQIFGLDQDIEPDTDPEIPFYRELIWDLTPKKINESFKKVKDTYDALKELGPDLFDLGFIMYGADPEQKLRQYLWQIYGTKCDFFVGHIKNASPESLNYSNLDTTALRMGFVIDYLISEIKNKPDSDPNTLDEYPCSLISILADWGGNEQNYQNAKKDFIQKYDEYLEFSRSFHLLAYEISKGIADTLKNLCADTSYQQTAIAFSDIYSRYYSILDELLEIKTPSDNRGMPPELDNRMFRLCVDMITQFQENEELSKIRSIHGIQSESTNTAAMEARILKSDPTYEIWTVEDSASLSYMIKRMMAKLSFKPSPPVLWYRGQRSIRYTYLPNIMRQSSKIPDPLPQPPYKLDPNFMFFNLLQDELKWAHAKTPAATYDLTFEADWLAYLQHNGFATNLLDFSESLYTALYFAVEKWMNAKEPPTESATLTIFNPVLFNLAMEALDEDERAGAYYPGGNSDSPAWDRLVTYLEDGSQDPYYRREPPLFAKGESTAPYQCYFEWKQNPNGRPQKIVHRPKAALLPKNCERMQKQGGQFVFYDIRSDLRPAGRFPTAGLAVGSLSYDHWDLRTLHQQYHDLYERKKALMGSDEMENLPVFIPYMYVIEIKPTYYKDITNYLHAIGIHQYNVYPEPDKMAEDLKKQLNIL